jgi:O-acetyl-ADP-ribose deacetylase
MTLAIRAVQGDITKLEVDVIVNAANTSLLGGGGVDGAIHRAAGPDLVHECRLLGGCKVGEAKITKGYRLPSKFIVHTVGPFWRGGAHGENELLAACYSKSLLLADARGATSVAFPCISTGIYKFPAEAAAVIALATVRSISDSLQNVKSVLFCCFSEKDRSIYANLLGET